MLETRKNALKTVYNRKISTDLKDYGKITSYYGENVYSLKVMKETLPKDAYKAVVSAIDHGKKIDVETAHVIAAGMKRWAVEKGATHVTHWFQPMTGLTAEKHDSFLEFSDGEVIEEFSGKALVQQEPDASSFPHGGIRQTFEARGYTGWDPTSNAFIMESAGFKTLCIPSIFVSYSGEALDKKVPLLRSMEALDKTATEICQLFDKNVKKVHATLGAEQEYFLIDRSFFEARPDLVAAGRTVFGAAPAKGQELSDHYFGSIKERAFEFMAEVEREAHKLGIPLKTRHNEVAPHQFECAPMFEEANVAVDHNSLLMDVMETVAYRLDLAILFHEKPFAGVNGSGKHNNWSLSTSTGKNLLSPGKSPQDNLQFLLVLTSILKAVREHGALLRATIASSGNDHRLGANEAPPAIISVFLGEQLSNVLDNIEKGTVLEGETARQMSFGINKIPNLKKDNTDRNRTSPFAFTGNKFEFRAVGSTANNAAPVTIINTIVSDALAEAKKRIQKRLDKGEERKVAILDVVREFIIESKDIRFEGNGYSDEWIVEAERRGLPHYKTAPRAFQAFIENQAIQLFERHGVYSKREIESRYNVKQEKYIMDISIEAQLALRLAKTEVVPAAINYQKSLLEAISQLKLVFSDHTLYAEQLSLLEELTVTISNTNKQIKALEESFNNGKTIKDVTEQAFYFDDEVKVTIEALREHVDHLENMVDNDLWPLPKYSEMLFLM